MIDIILIIVGGICMVIETIGCLVPVLPGPTISFGGLLLLQCTTRHPFSIKFLVIYGILTILIILIDYIIPIYGTKKLHGSKYGIWGSIIGLVIGIIFFAPFGIIIGPFFGAFLGELIAGKKRKRAVMSALGSLIGFLTGTALKFALSISMAYFYIISLIA
jgi:uncharacterized protein YqgC (DUF456 family)